MSKRDMARTKLSPPRPMVGIRNYLTRDEARADIFQFMEGWYNRRRLHSALGYLTPEQKVAAFHAAASAA
jgi:putative transposase